jgi:dTDP-glucose 4,6-dehydratase/UDP-glucose 4-epimerase
MKILIIGSKGFIGIHAINYFSQLHQADCWGCDVVTDYAAKNYFLLDSSNSDFNELFESVSFDVCINCSGAASVPDSLKSPLRDFSLNTYNVVKILDAIRKHKPECKFINLSSAAVYGNPKRLPIKESDNPDPVSPYGLHKLFSEKLCIEYNSFFNLQTCSIRIFSAYGPGLKKQLLWDVSQKALLPGNELILFGSGNETRDFVYIDDIMLAIKLIIEKGTFNGDVYNLANGNEVLIKEIAALLLLELNCKKEIKFTGDVRVGDPQNWKADISKIKQLGYKAETNIETGIKKYVQWLNKLG